MLAMRVDAIFAQHQRLIAGDVLQPGQIIPENILVVQIDVEADEIDAPRVEIFRRRKIGESHQAIRRFRLGDDHQFVDEFLDLRARRRIARCPMESR